LWIPDRRRLNEPRLTADLTAVRKSEEALAVVRLVPRLTDRAAELDLSDPTERPNDPIGRAEARERVELLRIAVHAAALGANRRRQQHLFAECEEILLRVVRLVPLHDKTVEGRRVHGTSGGNDARRQPLCDDRVIGELAIGVLCASGRRRRDPPLARRERPDGTKVRVDELRRAVPLAP